jgi:hypothetical protein
VSVAVDTTVCRPMVPEPQTTAFDDERHARLRALSIADQGFLLAPARKLLGPNRTAQWGRFTPGPVPRPAIGQAANPNL